MTRKSDAHAVEQVLSWMLEGQTIGAITEAIRELDLGEPGKLLAAAAQMLRDEGVFDLEPVIGFCVLLNRTIIHKSMEIADLATALAAARELRKIAETHGRKGEPPARARKPKGKTHA